LLELLFELVFEFLLQVIVEVLVELGLRSTIEPFRKAPSPWVAAPGYAMFGAIAGGLSVLALPQSLVHGESLRLLNLAVTPVMAGLAMAALGAWRAKRGQQIFRIDRFSYGYLFALSMALVRFHFSA
jgi:hypothetical protein